MLRHPVKIAVGYKAGCGKDTFCDYVIHKLRRQYNIQKTSFASPIYNIMHYAQSVCGIEHNKDRKFLQFIGSDWGRQIDPDIWAKLTLNKEPTADISLISDLRHNNEFQLCKSYGWINIKVVRNNIDVNRIGNGNLHHSSETELDIVHDLCWDYIIYNNDSLQDFYKKIDVVLDDIFKRN